MPKKHILCETEYAFLKTSNTTMSLTVSAPRMCAVVALKESRFTLTGTLRLPAQRGNLKTLLVIASAAWQSQTQIANKNKRNNHNNQRKSASDKKP